MPDEGQLLQLWFIPQRAIVHEIVRRVVLSREYQSAIGKDLSYRLQMVLVDSLPLLGGVVCDTAGEPVVSTTPFLQYSISTVIGNLE